MIRKALVNIRDYHSRQRQNSWFDSQESGIILGQKVTPLARVGVYVPGGKAVYPSSVLMNVIPAKVAGVEQIIMTTPPGADGKVYPSTLVAAKEAGVDAIYKVGGAQAIAAMAFGTESIPKVDKIVGPGNIYVALAKKAVFGYVSIDSIAGPSEILVLADETANPRYVAADLLSQAEHDEMASAILITTSRTLAGQVAAEIDCFVEKLSRKEIITKSLENYGYILVADSLDDAIATVNEIASEHLELVTKNPFEVMTKIRNAEQSLSANIPPSRSATTLRDRIMCFRPTVRRSFSRRWSWMILSRNPASFPIPGMRSRMYTRTSSSSRNARNLRRMPTRSASGLRKILNKSNSFFGKSVI